MILFSSSETFVETSVLLTTVKDSSFSLLISTSSSDLTGLSKGLVSSAISSYFSSSLFDFSAYYS